MFKVGLVGLGTSNFELLKYIRKTYPEWNCFVSEQGEIPQERRIFLEKEEIEFEEGGHTEKLLESDSFIMSPGISPNSLIGKNVLNTGKPITTELEFALKELRKRKKGIFIGITGTNGKTTTVTMLGHILKESGLKTFIGGNIGVPLISAIYEDYDFYVLEVSSFQLSWFNSEEQLFHLSSVLNVAEDHLDYHNSFREYLLAKLKIVNLTSGYSILRNELTVEFDKLFTKNRVVPFSIRGETILSLKDGIMLFHKAQLELKKYIKAKHNIENALIAIALSHFLGLSIYDAFEKIAFYRYPDHRMSEIATIEGVKYIDDSKATNAHAVVKALDNFSPDNVVLILAGKGKNESYKELIERIRNLKKVIIIGKSLGLVEKLDCEIPFVIVDNMSQAVELAHKIARQGDVVLFSPGGASFDMYRNYKERGMDFIEKVNTLKEMVSSSR
ncbi:UDP-N-acetylmuramoyl-L-alanine--D-glutamate ligase [Kosmotoga pacifica]|uniref:UDP-N-acetylmuramoylalanine--D-glutamate ligase n=1 Tax=Kosmotoga pacifica TaxID=1330330 RepID=A0A0G2Z6B6_9BACT|nr:UDP-N-acetylmuramoyl-L-alanine--D-glutamate ligase [Kosmotoga pacifica]AKI97092.1 hypothetical protein IX53_03825 [Kosmotoga pacifica]